MAINPPFTKQMQFQLFAVSILYAAWYNVYSGNSPSDAIDNLALDAYDQVVAAYNALLAQDPYPPI